MLGQQRRVGASADWGRLRYTMDDGSARPSGSRSSASIATVWRTAPRRSSTGARAAGRASATSRSIVDPRDRHALVGPLPPDRRGDRRRRARATASRRDDAARDDPRRHGGRGPSRRRALPGAGRPARAHPVRRARRPDHRRRRGRSGVRDRRGEDHPGPRSRRPRDGPAPRPADADDPRRRRDDRRIPARLTTGSTGTRPAR